MTRDEVALLNCLGRWGADNEGPKAVTSLRPLLPGTYRREELVGEHDFQIVHQICHCHADHTATLGLYMYRDVMYCEGWDRTCFGATEALMHPKLFLIDVWRESIFLHAFFFFP